MKQRLTPATVLEVKRRFWQGESQAAIAASLGIGQSSVSDICTGRSFSFVPWPDGTYTPPARDERKRRAAGLDGESHVLDRIADMQGVGTVSLEETIEGVANEAEEVAAWRASLADMVEQIKELSDQEIDAEIKRIVEQGSVQDLNSAALHQSTSSPQEQAPATEVPPSPPVAEALVWEDVARIAGPRNRWVLLAADKPNLRRVIAVVYRALPPNDWNQTFVYPLIVRTAQILGISLEEDALL